MVSRECGGGGGSASSTSGRALYTKNKNVKRAVDGLVGSGKKKRPDSQQVELLNVESRPRSLVAPSNGEIHIGFRKLSYSVREGIFRNRRRRLLKDINGDFHAGELTAIMGPSGSGKSTLMNILAGYINREVKGKLFVNDIEREEDGFRKKSCYIMQDDNLQPLLTVMEAMYVAANLNLSAAVQTKDKRKRIVEILEALGLWDCRKVKTKNLSGGQRKRLSIALELLKNPQVMFFDEPTSGLDSSTTKQCVSLLKQLAQEGKTVICTIHQPSASVFEMFDHLYAISDGRCIYQGSIKGLIPYLEECGLQCPSYHNPADYLLEVANGEYGSHTEHLMGKSENGLCTDWRKNQRDTMQIQSLEHVEKMVQSGLLTPVKVPSSNVFRFSWYNTATQDAASVGAPPPPEIPTSHCDNNYSTSFFYQLYVLLKRTFLVLGRDRTLTYSRIATHVAIALFIGILYSGIGHDASNMLNNFNFMFFTVMFLMLTAFNCVTTTFPSQLPIIVKEHFNQWYSLGAYYLAVTFADIPIQALATLLYAVTTYFMTSQPYDAYRFLLFLVMCILISLVSQSFGMVIGASMDVKNGVIFGPFCFLPFVIFSGFFVQLSKAHPYMQWLFHTSFLKYSFEGLMLAIFGYDRPKLPCELEDYCHFVYPQRFLEEMDMSHASYAFSVYFLLGLVLFLRILAFLALTIQIRRRR